MFELMKFHISNWYYVKKNDISLFFYKLSEKISSIFEKIKKIPCYVFIHKYSRVFTYETGTVDVCVNCGKVKRKTI